jgi:hypothetical protein
MRCAGAEVIVVEEIREIALWLRMREINAVIDELVRKE